MKDGLTKKETDEMVDSLYEEENIRELLKDWLEVRRLKKTPNTRRALELSFRKLEKCAFESDMTIQEYLEEVIVKGWVGFYPIKNYYSRETNKDY